MKKADYSTISKTYDQARKISEANIDIWLKPIVELSNRKEKIVDLGCGTGRFAVPLAYKYSFPVTGIDNSKEMIESAKIKDTMHKIKWEIADLDNFNILEPIFNIVFMSHLLHHLNNKKKFLKNCYKLLFDNGKIFIRHGALEQIENDVVHNFFPKTLEIDRKRTLKTYDLEKILKDIGFKNIHTIRMKQNTYKNITDHYNKVSLKFSSVLTLISEEEFEAGLRKLKKYIENNPEDKWLLEDEMSLTVGYK